MNEKQAGNKEYLIRFLIKEKYRVIFTILILSALFISGNCNESSVNLPPSVSVYK